MDGLSVQPLEGTEGATCPFWSPDSRFVGFFADRKLKKIPAAGGTVLTICDAPDGRGAAWSNQDVIVFAPGPFTGLSRVSAAGGVPTVLTEVHGVGGTNRLPSFLPDGKHVLFLSGTSQIDSKDNAIYLLDLDSKKTTLFARENSEGRYVEPGYLVFVRDGNLMAQPMDARRLRVTGEAVPIAEKVRFSPLRWSGGFSFSRNGLLALEAEGGGRLRQLTWFDLDGKSLGTVGAPARLATPVSIAPDGSRAATEMQGAKGGAASLSIWMYDLARGVANPFTFGTQASWGAGWSPDGRSIAFCRSDGAILIKPADGSSEGKTVASGFPNTFITSWSPDGRFISLRLQDQKTGSLDVWILPTDGSRKPYPLLATAAEEREGKFSPDGRWLSYICDESGRRELYVLPFPGPGEKRQISTAGATADGSFWLDNGARIAYVQPPDRKLVAVDLDFSGGSLQIRGSHVLFGGRPLPEGPFDITRDGKRLLSAIATDEGSSQLTLVTNWFEELRKN